MRMEAFKLVVKFFIENPGAVGESDCVPVFHRWIQQHAVDDHLLIDVADYPHVHHGPGTLLVAHEANFSTDRAEGRLGLVYSRKQPLAGSFADRVRSVFTAALKACARLEGEDSLRGRVRFLTDEVVFRINDRLLAPNTAETFDEVKPDLEKFLSELYAGAAVSLEHSLSLLTLFEVRIKASQSPSVTTLLERLGASAAMATPSQ